MSIITNFIGEIYLIIIIDITLLFKAVLNYANSLYLPSFFFYLQIIYRKILAFFLKNFNNHL